MNKVGMNWLCIIDSGKLIRKCAAVLDIVDTEAIAVVVAPVIATTHDAAVGRARLIGCTC
jgi:hypothetical protein